MDAILANKDLLLAIGGFLLLLLEYFLGKTDLVKAGSTLELIINVIKKLLEALGVKKPSGPVNSGES